jgi:DnaJ family protein C protein 28
MMDDWQYIADKRIQEAMEQGKFDNLPGKGKPIDWDENPFTDPDQRAAFTLLKKAGFTLPWIMERQDIEADLDTARRSLLRAWKWCRNGSGVMHNGQQYEWDRALEAFGAAVISLNKRIQIHNLKVPSDGFQRLPINVERELEILTGGP